MSFNNFSNIILIGMPGAGKSTIGVLLAKELCRQFLDTDILIQSSEKASLQYLIDTYGYMELRKIEEKTILNISCENHIIATGGSAVYSELAMVHLKNNGIVIFLKISYEEILRRIANFESRGIARKPDQSIKDLFFERAELYNNYADITLFCDRLSQQEIVSELKENFMNYISAINTTF